MTVDEHKERFFKAITYDPDLTNDQISERFGIKGDTIKKWKKELGIIT